MVVHLLVANNNPWIPRPMPNSIRPSLQATSGQKPSLSRHKLAQARPIPKWYQRLFVFWRAALGPLGRLFLSIKQLSGRSKVIVLLLIIAISSLSYYLLSRPITPDNTPDPASNTVNSPKRPTLQKGTPDYNTLLPTGKNIDQLGGWTRVSPTDRNPAYAYTDQIGSIKIIVSQQPIPDDFKKDASKIKQFAQTYSAGHEITDGDTRIYSGVAEDGPESIIFSKNNLLIFIKADRALAESELISYIRSLQ